MNHRNTKHPGDKVAHGDAHPIRFQSSDWGNWIDHDGLMPPPFGGSQPSYIANTYDEDVWYSRGINPATGYPESIGFENIPQPFRWYMKWFLWCQEYTPTGGKRKGVEAFGSARVIVAKMGHFLRFVYEKGHKRLDMVPCSDIGLAVKDYLWLRDEQGLCLDKAKTQSTVARYLDIIDQAYFLGPGGTAYIPDGPLFHTKGIAVEILAHASPLASTLEIPEPVAHSLLNTAIDWVEVHALQIERLVDSKHAMNAAWDMQLRTRPGSKRYRFARSWINTHSAVAADLRTVLGLVQNAETFFSTTSHPEMYRSFYEKGDFDQFASCFHQVTERIVDLLVAACYVVIAGFSGFRADEILGIKEGWIVQKGDRAYIRSEIIKISQTGKYVTDRTVPLICLTASQVLTSLSAPYRERHEGRLFLTGGGNVISSNRINLAIQDLASTTGVPPFDFKSHQFRRFFALFYVRRFKGNLDALRRHFRHVSRDTILAYISDSTNAKYLIREEQSLAREIAHSLVTGDGRYGARQVGQREMKAMAHYKAQNLPPDQIEKRIQALIKKSYLQVTANEWGYCLIQKNDFTGSACGSKDGLPNHVNAAPEACGACRFSVVGREHQEWWEHTILLHQEILEHELSLKRLKEASKRIIEVAERVLALLEKPEGALVHE